MATAARYAAASPARSLRAPDTRRPAVTGGVGMSEGEPDTRKQDQSSAIALKNAHPTTKLGTLPPPALTLMTDCRDARATAPASPPAT